MDREKSKRAESSPKRGSKIPGREEGGKREGELLQPDLPKARTRLGGESGALPEPKERLLRRPKIESRILLTAPGSFGLILSNISMEIGPGDPGVETGAEKGRRADWEEREGEEEDGELEEDEGAEKEGEGPREGPPAKAAGGRDGGKAEAIETLFSPIRR
jgi:hypothetical protein